MSEFIRNTPINCPYCGDYIKEGRMSQAPTRNHKIMVECKWVCTKCGSVARRDEKYVDETETHKL